MCEFFNFYSREKAINTFSGNKGYVITLIRNNVEEKKPNFYAQFIRLIRLFKYGQNCILW